MIIAQEILSAIPEQRYKMITQKIPNFEKLNDNNLEKSKSIAKVINSFILDYINIQIQTEQTSQKNLLLKNNFEKFMQEEVQRFKQEILQNLKDSAEKLERITQEVESPTNIYELSKAVNLGLANNVSRTLSTKIGNFIEKIASVSPYVVNPEIEFTPKLKIKGIDLIAKNFTTGLIEYQQLKATRGALTGSQVFRAKTELKIHSHPVFCVAISIGNWTFNDNTGRIVRCSREVFWSRIGLDYNIFLSNLKNLFLDLDKEYKKLIN